MNISQTASRIYQNKSFLVWLAVFLVLSILFSIYVSVSLHSSDVQIATRYTAYGDTSYYRSQWYYLLNFVAYGVLHFLLQSAIAIKLLLAERPVLARCWLMFAVGILVISTIVIRSVLGVAYL